MAADDKVFDVAKPGSSKPETGSKPMVVGHKMMKDPTLTEKTDEKSEEPQGIQQTGGKTIKPLDKKVLNESTDDNTEAKTETSTSGEVVIKPLEKESEEKSETKYNSSGTETKPESDTTVNEETPAQKEKSAQDHSLEQEENLQRIIREKTYNVHINEASLSAKTFIKTFIIVAIIGIIILVALIDADVIDMGVSLPFDFL